jgi:hypothetical protein
VQVGAASFPGTLWTITIVDGVAVVAVEEVDIGIVVFHIMHFVFVA